MPRIRLIKVHEYDGYNDNAYEYTYDEMSPWQEITDEELALLTSWRGKALLEKDYVRVVVWQDVTTKETVTGYINDIKQFIAKEQKRQEEVKKKLVQKIAQSKEAAAQKKIEKAKKLLKDNGIDVP